MEKENGTEKLMRYGRNANVAVALGFAAVSLVAPPAIIGAYWNGAQAVGFEGGRRFVKKRKSKKA